MSKTLAAVALWALALGGCAKQGAGSEATMPPPPEATATAETATTQTEVIAEPAPPQAVDAIPNPPAEVAAAPAPAPLNDAQIAKVLECVDTGEIEQAKVAQKKLKDPRVKQFAKHMIQQHTKSEKKGSTVTKKEQITPEESPLASELTGKASEVVEQLKTADAASIDSMYIEAQARQHQEVLDLLNGQLIPAASDEQLKSLLSETRAMVESHLARAKEIQQTFASAAGATSASPETSMP